jgi:dihydroorotate dehydrogenase electron transfer subunit
MPVDIDAVVLSNDRLTELYNVVKLAAPEIASVAQPGQFVMVRHGDSTAPLLRRPFSVFEILRDAPDHVSGFSLLNKRVGVVTDALFALQAGDRLRCLGPLGQPFSVGAPPAEAWMVAGGVGLAPFATLAEALHRRKVPTTLFYGGRSASDLFYVDWFERLGVRVLMTTEDGSRGEPGFVTGALEQQLSAVSPATNLTIHACGPTVMMRAVIDLADRYGHPTEVSLEPIMGCGLAGCYSCVVGIRDEHDASAPGQLVRSCLEGPVFPGHRIDWGSLAATI